MSVTDSRRLARNPQVVRRRRICETCGTSFQTDEEPRLLITRAGDQEPFLRGLLLASVRRAAADCDPPVADKLLRETVRLVIVGMLAEGLHAPSTEEVRKRTGRVLLDEQDLKWVAYRYDPSLDPYAVVVGKYGGRSAELFNRDKLKSSIAAASAGFLDEAEIEQVVDEIEGKIGATSTDTPLDTAELRAMVDVSFRRRDERAFLRYALGGHVTIEETLDQFLDRIASAQVLKRDGTVVLFDETKLIKSIRRSFVADRRNDQVRKISAFVASEKRRVRQMATNHEPEPTAAIGNRILDWLFDLDELAWANYWLAFASDHELVPSGSPALQLAKAHTEMQRRRGNWSE